MWRTAARAWPLALLLCGCGEAASEPAEPAAATAAAIKDGSVDSASTAVVAVIRSAGDSGAQALCTGALIAPNVVLTARHCVSATSDGGQGVSCSETIAAAPHAADTFRVTTAVMVGEGTAEPPQQPLPVEMVAVDEVVVPPVDALLCGHDIALLILADSVPAAAAQPLQLRLTDPPLVAGEIYSAVGYGAVDGEGQAAGVRRRRDGLTALCTGEGCAGATAFGEDVHGNEWVGDGGVCEGDSGGPALDADGRIIGVTSRGAGDCGLAVYTSVAAYQDWLQDTVIDAGTEAVITTGDGCSVVPARRYSREEAGWLLVLGIAVARRLAARPARRSCRFTCPDPTPSRSPSCAWRAGSRSTRTGMRA